MTVALIYESHSLTVDNEVGNRLARRSALECGEAVAHVERTRSFLADLGARHDRERVVATGHSASLWALQHLLESRPLEELVAAPFARQEGWEFAVEP